MKSSEMANEALARWLETVKFNYDVLLREAAARLRRPTPVDDDLLKMARDIDKLRAKLKVAEDALDKIYKCVDNKRGVDVSLLVKSIIADNLAAIRGERDEK